MVHIGDNDLFHGADDNDPSSTGGYITNPEYVWSSSNTAELEVNARVNHYGATAGNATVKVTYI